MLYDNRITFGGILYLYRSVLSIVLYDIVFLLHVFLIVILVLLKVTFREVLHVYCPFFFFSAHVLSFVLYDNRLILVICCCCTVLGLGL